MWTDERPRIWSDIMGQNSIKGVLVLNLENKTFPQSIMFSGAPGTGKSSVAELVGKALMCDSPVQGNPCYACESCKKNDLVKKFNMARYNKKRSKYDKKEATSADDKSINEVVAEIFDYQSINGKAVYILEELDCLSEENQAPFLEEMMHMPENTYIIICTNYKYKIISSIRSRCVDTPFNIPTTAECVEFALTTLNKRGLTAPPDSLKLLISICKNEPRSIVKYLEFFSSSGYHFDTIREYFQTTSESTLDVIFQCFKPEISIEDFSIRILDLEEHEPVQIIKALPRYLMKALVNITKSKCTDVSSSCQDTALTLGTNKLLKLMELVSQLNKSAYISDDVARYQLMLLKYQLEKTAENTLSRINTESAARVNVMANQLAHSGRITNSDTNKQELQRMSLLDGIEEVSDLQLSNFFTEGD